MHSLPATRKSSQFHNGGVMLELEIRHVSHVWQCCTYRILWRRYLLVFPPCKLVISHFMNLFKIETKLSPCQSGLLSIRWRRKLVLTPSPFLQVLYNIVKHHYPPLHVCWSWCAAGAGVAVVQYWSVVTIIAQVSAAAALTTPRWTPRISYSLTQL